MTCGIIRLIGIMIALFIMLIACALATLYRYADIDKAQKKSLRRWTLRTLWAGLGVFYASFLPRWWC